MINLITEKCLLQTVISRKGINLQSLEDTQVGYILQKYTLDNYTLEKYTLAQKSLVMVATFLVMVATSLVMVSTSLVLHGIAVLYS